MRKLFPVDYDHVKSEKDAVLKATQLASNPGEFASIVVELGYECRDVAANANGGFRATVGEKRFESIWNPGGRRSPSGILVNKF